MILVLYRRFLRSRSSLDSTPAVEADMIINDGPIDPSLRRCKLPTKIAVTAG